MDANSKQTLGIAITIFGIVFVITAISLGIAMNQRQELKESLAATKVELTDSTAIITGLRTSNEILKNIIKASNQELAATRGQVDSVNNLLRQEKAGRRADKNAFEARLNAAKDASDTVLQNTKFFLEQDAQEKLRLKEDDWSNQYKDMNLERIILCDSLDYMSKWCKFYQHQDNRPWISKVIGSGKIDPPEDRPPIFK